MESTLSIEDGVKPILSFELVERLKKRLYHARKKGEIDPEWRDSSKFVDWAVRRGFKHYDWLIPNLYSVGNKLYGPETAAIVPPEVGEWLNPLKKEGFYLGVRLRRRNPSGFDVFMTSSSLCRESIVKATFYTQIEAHMKFLEFRLEIGYELAKKISNYNDRVAFLKRVERVAQALQDRKVLVDL